MSVAQKLNRVTDGSFSLDLPHLSGWLPTLARCHHRQCRDPNTIRLKPPPHCPLAGSHGAARRSERCPSRPNIIHHHDRLVGPQRLTAPGRETAPGVRLPHTLGERGLDGSVPATERTHDSRPGALLDPPGDGQGVIEPTRPPPTERHRHRHDRGRRRVDAGCRQSSPIASPRSQPRSNASRRHLAYFASVWPRGTPPNAKSHRRAHGSRSWLRSTPSRDTEAGLTGTDRSRTRGQYTSGLSG